MSLRLLVAIAAVFSFTVYADTMSNRTAGTVSFVSGVAQAGLSYASKAKLANVLTHYHIYSDAIPEKLTTEKVNQVMAEIENSWLPARGVGNWGGAEVELVFDQGQINRMIGADSAAEVDKTIGVKTPAQTNLSSNSVVTSVEAAERAKPQMSTQVLKVRMLGSTDVLRAKLEEAQKAGAVVSRLGVRTFARGAGWRVVSGTLFVYFVGTAASNTYQAINFSITPWVTGTAAVGVTNPCKANDQDCRPGVIGSMFNTADAWYYAFYADK